jgi:hypothetical protein
MPNLTHTEFLKALEDKFTAEELCELLGLDTGDIIDAFPKLITHNRGRLEDELKYGH